MSIANRTKLLAIVAQASFAGFLAITILVPFFRDDLNPIDNAISHYLVGPYNWLIILSFMLLGLGASLNYYLLRNGKNSWLKILLVLYSIGVVLAGLTHPDSSAHGVGALLAFSTVPLMVASVRHRHWRLWFFAIVGSFVLWLVWPFGLAERITTFLEVAWLILLSGKVSDTDQ